MLHTVNKLAKFNTKKYEKNIMKRKILAEKE